ncbi:MAG: TIR domain-containing protein [bacterium]|nr:TIR domain-containing protein [bacterium]
MTDLHLGCPGRDVWWQVQEEFMDSIHQAVSRIGHPDLILLTGSLTFTGSAAEYELVDQFLDWLMEILRETGSETDPLIIPVPGNHDMQRPGGTAAFPYLVLDQIDHGSDNMHVADLQRELWDHKDASFITPLFSNYLNWLRRRIAPQFEEASSSIHLSYFPGDLSASIDLDDAFPLLVVGLNSAWVQYRAGDFEQKLHISARQFQAALLSQEEASPLEVFRRHPCSLLLMHHSPSWLSPPARRIFLGSIYPPGRFTICLYGHLHSSRSEGVSASGGGARHYFQTPSLFGLMHYGAAREKRKIGYSWGAINALGEVRVWPLSRVLRGDGAATFVHDFSFHEDAAGVLIRAADKQLPKSTELAEKRRPRKLRLFYSYAHEDENFRDQLEKHLTFLVRLKLIEPWHDRKISPGTEWNREISDYLKSADIILLLVSIDFINSEYCWGVEVDLALKRHKAGDAVVIPIILRDCIWQDTPFGILQALPRDGRPVAGASWYSEDQAFTDVARGVRQIVMDWFERE